MKKKGEFVGVDDKFIPENEKYVDDSKIVNNEKAKKVGKGLAMGYLCLIGIVMAFIVGAFIFQFNMINSFKNDMTSSFEQQKNDMISSKQ